MPSFDATDIIHGNCLEVMAEMRDCCLDSSVTDPPYHFKGARGSGFMNQAWDGGTIAFQSDTWREVLRVLKPGAHLLVFGGSRTFHRVWCAVEDAGAELRDTLLWIHAEGLPKSRNIAKLDGATEFQGWGTAIKPSFESIGLFRKPLTEVTVADNMRRYGTGALNVEACRVPFVDAADEIEAKGKNRHADYGSPLVQRAVYGSDAYDRGQQGNYDALGRFPSNLLHDGSLEVTSLFPSPHSAGTKRDAWISDNPDARSMFKMQDRPQGRRYGDVGSAARFFPALGFTDDDRPFLYCPKASTRERQGSTHKTIKPLALMRWLVRLITPPGGTVFDPFAGTGTTGQAALEQGFGAFLIEQDHRYIADIHRRLAPFLHSSHSTAARTISLPPSITR